MSVSIPDPRHPDHHMLAHKAGYDVRLKTHHVQCRSDAVGWRYTASVMGGERGKRPIVEPEAKFRGEGRRGQRLAFSPRPGQAKPFPPINIGRDVGRIKR